MAESKINIRALFDLKGFSTSAQNLERRMKKTARELNQVGQQMSTAFTLPLVGLGALAVKSAADFESLKTSLTTSLGGSAEAAKQAFSEIEKFAASTPFAMAEVTTAFIKLKNMGLDPSMEALKSYGNTASSMGKSLNDMVEAVADAAVGEFERLKEFGIKAKTEGDRVSFTFKGVTTEVGKNSEEIQEYLLNIGNTDFAGGIEKQSQTFNGVLSTLKDNMALAASSFGEMMLPVLKKLATALQGLAEWIRGLTPETKSIIIQMGLFAASIGPVLYALGLLTTALAFFVAHPAIAALAAIGGALAVINIAAAQTNKLFPTTQTVINNLKDAYSGLDEQLQKINGLKERGIKLSKEEIQAAMTATKAVIKQTEAIIAQSVARYQSLIQQAEAEMQATLAQTRGVGMQGEFIGADLAKIESTKKNIAALAQEINNANDKLRETQKTFDTLESDLKAIKTTTETVSNSVDSSVDKITKSFKELNFVISEIDENKLKNIGTMFSNFIKKQGKALNNELEISINLKLPKSNMPSLDWIDEQAAIIKAKYNKIGQDISQALNDGLKTLVANSAILMGEFLGNVMSGSDVTIEDFGKSILNAIGMFMSDFGKAMIAIGVSQLALDMAIKTMNAPLAIAAGIALVAAGTALSNVANKGIEGAGGPNSTSPSASTRGMNNLDLQPIVLETRIQGSELILVQDRSRQFRR